MWKLHNRRLVNVTVACGAALALVVACSSSDDNSGSATGGTGGRGGSSSGGKGGGAGRGGTSSGGTSSGGTSSGGTSSGGTSSGGTSSGGTSSGGTGTGGTAHGGGGGSAGGGAGSGGHAGLGQAGDFGAAGDLGAAGAPAFVPYSVPLVNAGFENGTDNMTAPGWPTVPANPTCGPPPGAAVLCASYVNYLQGAQHAGFGHLALFFDAPYVVSTSQTVSNLTNGTYELAAWVTSSTTNALYLFATGYSSANPSAQVKTDIVGTAAYVQYKVSNIQVTSGTLTIGVYIDAPGTKYANIDDFTLTRVE